MRKKAFIAKVRNQPSRWWTSHVETSRQLERIHSPKKLSGLWYKPVQLHSSWSQPFYKRRLIPTVRDSLSFLFTPRGISDERITSVSRIFVQGLTFTPASQYIVIVHHPRAHDFVRSYENFGPLWDALVTNWHIVIRLQAIFSLKSWWNEHPKCRVNIFYTSTSLRWIQFADHSNPPPDQMP